MSSSRVMSGSNHGGGHHHHRAAARYSGGTSTGGMTTAVSQQIQKHLLRIVRPDPQHPERKHLFEHAAYSMRSLIQVSSALDPSPPPFVHSSTHSSNSSLLVVFLLSIHPFIHPFPPCFPVNSSSFRPEFLTYRRCSWSKVVRKF